MRLCCCGVICNLLRGHFPKMATSSLIARLVFPQRSSLTVFFMRKCSSQSYSTGSPSPPSEKNTNTESTLSNNSSIQPRFFNRNPRNLEKLTIARKPQGFHLDKPGHTFWHKLKLSASRNGIVADIVHYSGSTVLSVSTAEYGIRKFLHSATDVAAHTALGKILARRCLESGIHFVMCETEAAEGTKVHVLLKEAEKNGLNLTEPNVFRNPARWGRGYPTKPWDVIT